MFGNERVLGRLLACHHVLWIRCVCSLMEILTEEEEHLLARLLWKMS
jgi:DNA-binding MarR family transcriptional regulator